jgi:hypothetical protein
MVVTEARVQLGLIDFSSTCRQTNRQPAAQQKQGLFQHFPSPIYCLIVAARVAMVGKVCQK